MTKKSEFSDIEQTLLEEFAFRMSNEISELRVQISGMRLDRQLRDFPRWVLRVLKKRLTKYASPRVKNKIKLFIRWWRDFRPEVRSAKNVNSGVKHLHRREKKSLLILAHGYPRRDGHYQGMPLARRVPFYQAAGFKVTVLVPGTGRSTKSMVDQMGTEIFSAPLKELEKVAKRVGASQLVVHSPTPDSFVATKNLMLDLPTSVWIHGFEARNWRELQFDFSDEDIALNGLKLDIINVERRWALAELFSNPAVNKVFVSEFMRSVAEDFTGTTINNGQVIHNVIDTNIFPFMPKPEAMRMSVCSVRSFAKRNYATDLMGKAIFELSKMPWFSKMQFQIIGDGHFFDLDTKLVSSFQNVKITKKFVGPGALKTVFEESGIALMPTRWDSQGLVTGEAMASGLVPVVNGVTAIPEFISPTEGKLAKSESYLELAEGIADLVENPKEFLEMSHAAHTRVVEQCGPAATVEKEIELFRQSE